MSEFLEILSPSAKADLEAIMPLVDKLAKDIKEINNFKASGTPSGADNAIKKQTESLKEQGNSLDQVKKKLEMISSLNKQRYQEEAKLIADNDKALTYKSEKELKQIRDKQAMIASLNKQKEQERKETEKTLLANEKLNRAYVQLNKQRELAKNKLQDLIASERASNAEIRKAQKEFDVLNKKVAAADKAVGRFSEANRQINGLTKSVGNLMTAFGIGTGLYLAVDIVKGIYDTTKALQSMDLALKMVSETPLELAKNQQFVTETAEKWGLEIKTLQKTFTQFYTASKGLLTDDSIKTTFEGIAKAGSIMGLSLEQQQAAFYAIDQMMSKGTVTAEELKKQLGNAMPGAIKAAAMAYMELHPAIKSIQEAEKGLYADMKKGAIDSATYVPLIAKNFQILYGIESLNSVHTMQAAQNRLQNSWTEWIKGISSGGTGMKMMVSLMESLAKNLDTIATALGLSITGWIAYKGVIILAALEQKRLLLVQSLTTTVTAAQTTATGTLTTVQGLNVVVTNGVTAAWTRLKVAMMSTGLGGIIVLLGSLVAAAMYFHKSLEETTQAVKEETDAFITNREVVAETVIENEKLIKRYEELKKKIKEVGDFTKLSKEEQSEYNSILANLSKQVPNAVTSVNNYGVAIKLNTDLVRKYNKELLIQSENKRKIALAENRELLPRQKKEAEWYTRELKRIQALKKRGTLKYEGEDIDVAIARADKLRSEKQNIVTMTEGRIRSMEAETEANKATQDELDDKKKKVIKDIEWYDEQIKNLRKTEAGLKTRQEGLIYQKELDRLQKERAFILGEEEKKEKGSIKDKTKDIEDALKTEYDLKMSNLEREKEIIKDLRDNKETSLEDMLFLEQAFAYKEIQIAQAVYDEEVRLAGESGAKQQMALNKFLTAKENAIKDSQDRQAKSQEDFTKEQLQKTKDWYAKNPPIGIFETGTSKEDRENDLAKKRQQFKDTVKLFNEFAGDFASKSGFSQTFENFFKENKEGVSLFDTLFDDESILSKQEKQLAAFQVISSAAQDTMNLISDFEEERFQRSIYRLEREKEIALQFAGDSAAAKEKIEAQFEKKRIDLEKKEFKRKQKMAIANIAIDTAQAIIGLWVKPGFPAAIPMSIAMGALGIAQAGMVASQKPPEYWKGTDNAEAGLAWTQERGAEIVLDKHNRIKSFGSDGGAQLTMLDKGDKVKTADQTKKLMFDNGLNSILSDNGIKEAKIEIVNSGITVDEMDMVIGKHFANIQTNHTSFDNRGIQQWSEKNGNRTIRNSNRGSGIGFKV